MKLTSVEGESEEGRERENKKINAINNGKYTGETLHRQTGMDGFDREFFFVFFFLISISISIGCAVACDGIESDAIRDGTHRGN